MPPLPKTCPKMVLPIKGGSLCVKDAFAKKIFWCRERFRWRRLRSATASIQNNSGLPPRQLQRAVSCIDMRRRGFIMLLGGRPGGHETGQREAKTKVPPDAE
jgi:hypothetical protein